MNSFGKARGKAGGCAFGKEHPTNQRLLLDGVLVCGFLFILGGCTHPGDFLARMEAAARPEPGVQQTQFAHIGRVLTDEGTFEVATQRRVTAGMMAPRGQPTRLLLFDSDGKLVSSYDAAFSTGGVPLWCEGSRVYLWGFSSWNVSNTFNAVEADPGILEHRGKFRSGDSDSVTGNVLDFRRGPTKPILTREKRYGSSGGIEDDPWEIVQESKE